MKRIKCKEFLLPIDRDWLMGDPMPSLKKEKDKKEEAMMKNSKDGS